MVVLRPGRTRILAAAACVCAVVNAVALAQTVSQDARGELLYSTHCIACHTTQVHWRQQKLARDWTSLVEQVRRWARNAGVGWSDEEIVDVARYLNATYYRFAIATLTGEAQRGPWSRTARVE